LLTGLERVFSRDQENGRPNAGGQMFSRWKGEPKSGPAAASHDAPTPAAGAAVGGWPWEPDQSVAVQLVINTLLKFFPKSLAQNGRLQVETLFCTIGEALSQQRIPVWQTA
jgi:hypothetical protein